MDNRPYTYGPLFNQQGDLTPGALWGYAHGMLAPVEVRAIEEHLQACEFCREAVEGAALFADKDTYINSVVALNQQVDERIGERKRVIGWQTYRRLAVAAILVLVAGGAFFWFNNNTPHYATVAQKENTPETPPVMVQTIEPTLKSADGNMAKDAKPAADAKASGTINLNSNGATSPYTYKWKTSPAANNRETDTVLTTNNITGSATADDAIPKNKADWADQPVAPAADKSVAEEKTLETEALQRKDSKKKERERRNAENAGVAYGTYDAKQPTTQGVIQSDTVSLAQGYYGNATSTTTLSRATPNAAPSGLAEQIPTDNNLDTYYKGGQLALQQYIDSAVGGATKNRNIRLEITMEKAGKVALVKILSKDKLKIAEQQQLTSIIIGAPGWQSANTEKKQLVFKLTGVVKF